MLENITVIHSETDGISKFNSDRLKRSILNYFNMARVSYIDNEINAKNVLKLVLETILEVTLELKTDKISSNFITTLIITALVELGDFSDIIEQMPD